MGASGSRGAAPDPKSPIAIFGGLPKGLEARLDRSKKVRTPSAGRVEAERGAASLGRAEGLHRHDGTAAVEEEDATVRHEVELG